MPKKLTETIYLLILNDYALQGLLMAANRKSSDSIKRWAREKMDQLILNHNLETILDYCHEVGLDEYETTNDLLEAKQAELN